MLPHLISDRVKELRAEIATIHHANLLYRKGENAYTQESGRGNGGLERLRYIMDELRALADWKNCIDEQP